MYPFGFWITFPRGTVKSLNILSPAGSGIYVPIAWVECLSTGKVEEWVGCFSSFVFPSATSPKINTPTLLLR